MYMIYIDTNVMTLNSCKVTEVSNSKCNLFRAFCTNSETLEFVDAKEFTLVCPVRRGANRHLPSTVSPGAADHREGGCSQQLCARSLHHRQGNCRFGAGSHQETCKCNRVAGSCEVLNIWYWFKNELSPFFWYMYTLISSCALPNI